MSTLLARLNEIHAMGHARDDVELHFETRPMPASELRGAAVLAAITDRERPGVLLIHRPSTMRAHPGQVAFPGGKIDPGETAIEAALREAHEELGILPSDVRVVGSGDRYRTGTGFDITPVVGLIPPDLDLTPNPTEVAQWFEAPLDFVLDHRNHARHSMEVNGVSHSYWQINWQEHRIWGATAAMLVNLSRRWNWRG